MKSILKKLVKRNYLFYAEINDFCRWFATKDDMLSFVSDYQSKNVVYSINMFKFIVKDL